MPSRSCAVAFAAPLNGAMRGETRRRRSDFFPPGVAGLSAAKFKAFHTILRSRIAKVGLVPSA
jgi:hypothetical protein